MEGGGCRDVRRREKGPGEGKEKGKADEEGREADDDVGGREG